MKRFLWSSAAVSLLLGGWAFCWEPSRLVVERVDLELGWSARAPLRVAVLSDLHVGSPFNGLRKLEHAVQAINEQKPDLVCLLGDLVIQGVIGGSFVAPEEIGSVLGRLHAPLGRFAVLGNHDAWLDHARVGRALTTNGVRLVEDTAVRLETPAGRLWIAGVSDRMTRAHDLKAALAAITDTDTPAILLTHNPDVFPDVPARVSVTLAGHTHGGQVNLPAIGRLIVPSAFGSRYAAGHVVEGGRHLFVTTGVGTSILPVRFRVPPTVSVLTLKGRR